MSNTTAPISEELISVLNYIGTELRYKKGKDLKETGDISEKEVSRLLKENSYKCLSYGKKPYGKYSTKHKKTDHKLFQKSFTHEDKVFVEEPNGINTYPDKGISDLKKILNFEVKAFESGNTIQLNSTYLHTGIYFIIGKKYTMWFYNELTDIEAMIIEEIEEINKKADTAVNDLILERKNSMFNKAGVDYRQRAWYTLDLDKTRALIASGEMFGNVIVH